MESNSSPVVCSFESRRADEMRSLIERHGGRPLTAPSMREKPLQENDRAVDVIRQIVAGDVDAMILLTGVGTEAMLQLAAAHDLHDRLIRQMQQIPQLVRGPKPAAVLKRLGIQYRLKAPEPNTWRELAESIEQESIDLHGQTIVVQEYGVPNPALNDFLQQRGATVVQMPVYRWELPTDLGPLKSAIGSTIGGEIDVLLFTSAQQVRHVLQVAAADHRETQWTDAAARCVVASIGPTCTEAIRETGLPVHFEAAPPKMGPLVRGALQHWKDLS